MDKPLSESALLYRAAELMKAGFVRDYRRAQCGCFAERVDVAIGLTHWPYTGIRTPAAKQAIRRIKVIVGDITAFGLRHNGWEDGNTDDATAALTIAADLAFEDERAGVMR